VAKRANRPAKRANRPNPRVDRNSFDETNTPAFIKKKQNRYRNQQPPEEPTFKPSRVEIVPRNLAQEEYLEMLRDENKAIVFAMGAAGTGKTLLATLYAIEQLQQGNVKKIVITRPAVSVDEQHGFLPGSLVEKMAPWVIPIMDVFKEYFSVYALEKMLKEEVIEIAPLAFMRGRNLKNCIVLADEMQNATQSQMKMLLTRISDNSRMIVTGDLRQHDRGYESNGLKDFVERLPKFSNYIAVCEFSVADVERHPVVEEVLRIYGDE
jgi:phosphate starvation-inducible PhoH-like protein